MSTVAEIEAAIRALPEEQFTEFASWFDKFELQRSQAELLEGIGRGETAIKEARTVPHEQARNRMKRWLA